MKSPLLTAVLFISLMATTSAVTAQRSVKVSPDQVPAEFENYDDTLLLVNTKVIMGYSKFLKKNFAEHYKGKYKIISRDEYINKPGNHFRFAFEATFEYTTSGFDNVKLIQYILHDNKTGKSYKTVASKYYSELMVNYIKELNKRLGNL